jgi:hypothetical protein
MFENTLALYEWHRSRLDRVERRLGRCAGAVIDTGYKESLETQRTTAMRRVHALEDAVALALRDARPPLPADDVPATAPTADGAAPLAAPASPDPLPTRLMSWLRLRIH